MFLITGGAGYIGSHVVQNLMLTYPEEQICVLDNLSTGHLWAISKEITFIQGNVGDAVLLDQVFSTHENIHTVMHFAADIDVTKSLSEPTCYYENNIIQSFNLINKCVEKGVKNFIFSSTCAVYGNDNKIVSENTSINPMNPYAKSKIMCEWFLQDIAPLHNMKYVILRYFNVVGAAIDNSIGQATKNSQALFKVLSECIVKKRNLFYLYGNKHQTKDGTCIRDYIHVQDLAQAHVDSYQYLYNQGQNNIFNCGYGTGYTVHEIIDHFEKTTQIKLPLNLSDPRPGEIIEIIADNTKIKKILGWKPRYNNLDFMVKSAVDWENKLLKINETQVYANT